MESRSTPGSLLSTTGRFAVVGGLGLGCDQKFSEQGVSFQMSGNSGNG